MAEGYAWYPNRPRTGAGLRVDYAAVRQEIASWPGYEPAPLVPLAGLAQASGVGEIWYKDESRRFGLGSFKALGGAYAVFKLLQAKILAQTGEAPSSADLRAGSHAALTRTIHVATTTDGNHGRSVAWGAQMFHCPCTIYVPRACSPARAEAIARFGADVVRSAGGYDEAVRECARDAERNGWLVVSDTSWDGYESIPEIVMQGYTVMTSELIEQLGSIPTHAFIQAGVGGLAAAVCSHLNQVWGAAAPQFVIVEPAGAACLFASAAAGKPVALEETRTQMAGLDCGEVSLLAWRVLADYAAGFMTVPDSVIAPCMRMLASSPYGDPPIVAGESAIAGLAGLLHAVADPQLHDDLAITSTSRILLFGTEGATDPELYAALTGSA